MLPHRFCQLRACALGTNCDTASNWRVSSPCLTDNAPIVNQYWRRWTGIEPAGRGSPIPPALKAGEPTRRSDTSTPDATAKQETLDGVGSVEAR